MIWQSNIDFKGGYGGYLIHLKQETKIKSFPIALTNYDIIWMQSP